MELRIQVICDCGYTMNLECSQLAFNAITKMDSCVVYVCVVMCLLQPPEQTGFDYVSCPGFNKIKIHYGFNTNCTDRNKALL